MIVFPVNSKVSNRRNALLQVASGRDDAVVLEDHAVVALREGRRDGLAERDAARKRVRRESALAADLPRLVEEARVGHLVNHAERDERDRMGVDDPAHVGSRARRRPGAAGARTTAPRSLDRAVGPDEHDVRPAEPALVDACRRDPDVAVLLAHREVAAGGGRHPVAVDPLHRPLELVARMQERALGVTARRDDDHLEDARAVDAFDPVELDVRGRRRAGDEGQRPARSDDRARRAGRSPRGRARRSAAPRRRRRGGPGRA